MKHTNQDTTASFFSKANSLTFLFLVGLSINFLLIDLFATAVYVPGLVSEGKASWLGERFQGKKTTSGEAFDMNDLTASHGTLPYGSLVKVTSQRSKRSVIARVNDRAEIGSGRIIDLSKRAAESIGLVEEGIGLVSLEVVSLPTGQNATASPNAPSTTPNNPYENTPPAQPVIVSSNNAGNVYKVQYGSFNDLQNALEFRDKLKAAGLDVSVDTLQKNGQQFYRVHSTAVYDSSEKAKCHIVIFSPNDGVVVSTAEEKLQATTLAPSKPAEPKKPVSLPPAPPVPTNQNVEYGIQFGAFETQANAKALQNKLLAEKKVKTIIHQFSDDQKKLYRVLSEKPFASETEAQAFLVKNSSEGLLMQFFK